MHSLILNDNANMRLEGITGIVKYSDKEVVLTTENHRLCVSGERLKVDKIDVKGGLAEINGSITGIRYGHSNPAGNLMRKLIR